MRPLDVKNMPAPKVTTFADGLRLVVAPLRGTGTVTVNAFIGVGSRYEDPTDSGISHFLEHLTFKGTARRPSAQILTEELDGVGGSYNAYTAKDRTSFYVKLPAEHLQLGIDIIADMVTRPLLPPEEVERERGVILEEINMYQDNPMLLIDELAEEQQFSGHVLGQRIIGPAENIRSGITREMIATHHAHHYRPDRCVVVVTGRCDPSAVEIMVRQHFTFPGADQTAPTVAESFHFTQTTPRLVIQQRKEAQVNLALAFPGVGMSSRTSAAAHVLATILGGTMSSRLFHEVRERLGLCYSISASHSSLAEVGSFNVSAGLDRARLIEALTVIRRILDEAVIAPPPEAELQRTITNMVGRIAMKVEDSASLADWLGTGLTITGDLQTPRRRVAALKRVTAKQVHSVAKKLLDWRCANLALIGPVDDEAAIRGIIQPHRGV